MKGESALEDFLFPKSKFPQRLGGMELLEPRIAPAAVFTYIDVDGDLVTVETSKGTDQQLAGILSFSAASDKRKLELVDFSANPFVFKGTHLTITAETAGGGNGLANIGRISGVSHTGDHPFIDLGNLVIDGDLGEIDAGDENRKTPGIKSLTVTSFGVETPDTFTASGTSQIIGGAGKVVIAGDVDEGADLRFDQIGSLQIDGTLFGGLRVATKLGFAVINKIDAEVSASAFLVVGSTLPAVVGSVQIGSIVPNASAVGTVSLFGKVKSLSVESVVAELPLGCGVLIEGTVKSLTFGTLSRGSQPTAFPVAVLGNVGTLALEQSDAGLLIVGNLGKATLAGMAGPGQLSITKNLGSLKVSGNLAGTALQPIVIEAGGNIGSIDIVGNVSFARIQAGSSVSDGGFVFSPDVRIGAVHVGGNWTASTLTAGVENNLRVVNPGPDKLTIISAIKSIVIDGAVAGTGSMAEEFGFAAQQIGSMKIGDTVIPFVKGPANDLTVRLIEGTTNVIVHEVGFSWPNLTPG